MPACRQWCSVQKAAVYFAGNRKEFTGASYVPEIAYRAEESASFFGQDAQFYVPFFIKCAESELYWMNMTEND